MSENDIENIPISLIRNGDDLKIREGIKSEPLLEEEIAWFDTGEFYHSWMHKAGDPKRNEE